MACLPGSLRPSPASHASPPCCWLNPRKSSSKSSKLPDGSETPVFQGSTGARYPSPVKRGAFSIFSKLPRHQNLQVTTGLWWRSRQKTLGAFDSPSGSETVCWNPSGRASWPWRRPLAADCLSADRSDAGTSSFDPGHHLGTAPSNDGADLDRCRRSSGSRVPPQRPLADCQQRSQLLNSEKLGLGRDRCRGHVVDSSKVRVPMSCCIHAGYLLQRDIRCRNWFFKPPSLPEGDRR